MGLYAAACGLWIPLNFWMMPWHALQVGQVTPGAARGGLLRRPLEAAVLDFCLLTQTPWLSTLVSMMQR